MAADTPPCGCNIEGRYGPDDVVMEHRKCCSEPTYPREKCGKPRIKAEGGATFTVCDECWGVDPNRPGVCRHGGLRRKCEPCDLEADIALRDGTLREVRGMLSASVAQQEAYLREIEALKAERDEWRYKAGLHQIASAAHKKRADYLHGNNLIMSQVCRALNKGIHRLRKGRDNAHKLIGHQSDTNSALRAEVARLEGLIVEQAIKARQAQ